MEGGSKKVILLEVRERILREVKTEKNLEGKRG